MNTNNTMSKTSQRAFGLVMTASALMPVAMQLSSGWGLPVASYLGLSAAVQHLYKSQLAYQAATQNMPLAEMMASSQARRQHRIFIAVHVLACVSLVAALWFSGRLGAGF